MTAELRKTDYILGHSARELDRLRRQAAVHAAFTREILAAAGLAAGQSVLDVGCGAGDVSFAAAHLVGPAGRVTGIDRSAEAVETAQARAAEAGLGHLRFEQAELGDGGPAVFDAVVGRFVLLHQTDPAACLRQLRRRLRPGGVIAFIEMDLSTAEVRPPMALFDRAMGWIRGVYDRGGFHADMGSRLYATFRAAGLVPHLVGSVRVEAGVDAYAPDYIAETVRSLIPLLTSFGLASEDEIEVETLADRIRAEVSQGDHCFFYPRMVGAFASESKY